MKYDDANHPRVIVPPPLIIGFPLVAGIALQYIFPLQLPIHWIGLFIGGLMLCALSVLTLFASFIEFKRVQTSMLPTSRSRKLIVSGPFKFSRNPMYAGLLLFYAGISLLINSAWLLIFLPVIVMALHYFAIRPEEFYLESRYRDVYRNYKKRVGRWF